MAALETHGRFVVSCEFRITESLVVVLDSLIEERRMDSCAHSHVIVKPLYHIRSRIVINTQQRGHAIQNPRHDGNRHSQILARQRTSYHLC